MSKDTPSSIRQTYLYYDELPYIELRYTHQSLYPYKAHSHEEFSFGAIVEGGTQLTIEPTGETLTLDSGALIFIEPNRVHRCNPLDNKARSYFMLYIDQEWLLNQAKIFLGKDIQSIYFDIYNINDPQLFGQYLRFTQQFQQKSFSLAQNTLLQLIEKLIKAYAKLPKPLRPKESIRLQDIKSAYNQYIDTPPKLGVLAHKHDICPETLIRSFKKQTGFSPKAYLNNLRIEKAKRLLKTGHNITEVAYALGFADQSHFQKTFVHYTASTPKQYQRKTSIFDNT